MLEAGFIPGDLGAFKKEAGKIKLYFGGGGGGGPTTTQSNTSNVPEYAKPYVENMLGSAQKQIYNDDMTTFRPYQAYSSNPNDYVAGYSPLQQNAQQGAANLKTPDTFGQGAAMAGMSGLGALETTGQAGMYGAQGNMAAQQAARQSMGYGGAGAMAGLGAAGQSSMYGGLGAMQGQQGADIGQSLGQMSTNANAQQAYMNPYLQNSLQPQLEEMQRQYGITGTQQAAQATQQGAFGGGRDAIMAAENQRNKNTAMNQAIGQGYNTAFTNAQQQMNAANQAALSGNAQAMQGYGMGLQGAGQAGSQAMQGFGMGLQGAGQAGQLGISGAQAGLQGIGAQQAGYSQLGQAGTNLSNIGNQQLGAQQGIIDTQNKIGTGMQAQEQQKINQQIQDYATQQQYPFMQLGIMNSLLRGLPLQSTTTQSYQAQPAIGQQALGLGLGALGASKAFS